MATTALLGYQGFEWRTADGGPAFYFSEDKAEVPTQSEWQEWLKKILNKETYHLPGPKIEKLVGEQYIYCLLTKKVRGKYLDHQLPYKYAAAPGEGRIVFQVAPREALEACEQGFVRRRNPRMGRKAAAFNGEPILIPAWVIREVNDWVGTQFNEEPLPSGKPKPVLKRR